MNYIASQSFLCLENSLNLNSRKVAVQWLPWALPPRFAAPQTENNLALGLFTPSIPSSPLLHNLILVISPLLSFITKDTIPRKQCSRTKTNSEITVWPTLVFLPPKSSMPNRKQALASTFPFSWERFSKELEMKDASGFNGNGELEGRVFSNAIQATSATPKHFKATGHQSVSTPSTVHPHACSKSVWTKYFELRSVALAFQRWHLQAVMVTHRAPCLKTWNCEEKYTEKVHP